MRYPLRDSRRSLDLREIANTVWAHGPMAMVVPIGWDVITGAFLLLALALPVLPAMTFAADQPESGQWRECGRFPVRAYREVAVPAREGGVLAEVLVRRDFPVAAGDLVARLDTSVAEADLAIAKAQLENARLLATDTTEVNHRRIVLSELQAELEKHLAIEGSISESELRSRRLGVEKAQVELHQAQRILEQARLSLKLAQARCDLAQLRLDRCSVHATISGIVAEVFKHPGEWVEAGEPLANIRDLSRMKLDWIVQLAEIDLPSLPGTPVYALVSDSSEPIRLRGVITTYDHQVSAQGAVRVRVELENQQRKGHWVLLPGAQVTLYVGLPVSSDDSERTAARGDAPSRLMDGNGTPRWRDGRAVGTGPLSAPTIGD